MIRFNNFITLLLTSFQTLFSFPDYSLQVANTKILNDSTISFEVYINSKDSSFELTSYQCVLSIDNAIPVYGFSYLKGTSSFVSVIPSVGLGFNIAENGTQLTFASLPGNEIISSNKIRFGTFLIRTKIDSNESLPKIEWCFDGEISTILTGAAFEDITKEYKHTQNNGLLNIINIFASSTSPGSSTKYLTDGKGLLNSEWNEAWTSTMPSYLIFDLGNTMKISTTKFEFNNWNKGRIFRYSIFMSNDTTNWDKIIANASSGTEWTIDNFENEYARYVKLLITGNNQNEWATLWEVQIYGSSDTSDAPKNNYGIKTNPREYKLSQNYPNPFNPSTKINFTLVEPGKVDLEVYNILGEKVSTLVNQKMTAGSHEVHFNASNLASGIYIYRINVNNKFTDTKKMILIK